MKKFIVLLSLFSSLLAQDGKLAISILDFTGEDVSDKLLRACYQKLETSLIESNRFTVIAKNQREQILEEMKFQKSGLCDEACAVEIGQLVGAEFLMIGAIIGFGDLYQINIKIVNIEKGDVVEKVTKEITGKLPDLLNGMAESSREITRRIASGGSQPIVSQPGIQLEQKKYGSIVIESDPPGATIFVDDVERGFTPKEISEIPVGTRRLLLVKPGYETLTKGIKIIADSTISISELLIPKTGGLSILSNPVGATVFINDIPRGNTPFDIEGLKIDDYAVTVSLDNYEPITQRVTVEYNENTTQKFDLKPLPGKVNIIVSPTRTEIKVGGKKYKAGASGIVSVPLPIGFHSISFKLSGYEPQEKTINIGPNENKTLEVNMKKRPAGTSSNPDMGFLTVHTYNSDVKLKVSGKRGVQDLPLEYYELKYGSYNLKAFKKGFESKKVKVDIERQKTTKIEVNLDKKVSRKALKYSLMMPGMGQIYAERKAKGLLFSSTTIGLAALVGTTFSNYSNENSLIDQYQKNYQNAISQSDIDRTFDIYQKQVNTVNDLQGQLLISGVSFFATYVINLIDARYFSGLK